MFWIFFSRYITTCILVYCDGNNVVGVDFFFSFPSGFVTEAGSAKSAFQTPIFAIKLTKIMFLRLILNY